MSGNNNVVQKRKRMKFDRLAMRKRKRIIRLSLLLSLGSVFLLTGFIMVSRPVNVQFELNPHGVENFVSDSVPSIQSNAVGRMTLPTPIRPGHRFLGWSEQREGGALVARATRRQMLLYAQWLEVRPRAHLFVDGHHLRDVMFPSTLAHGLGTAFVPTLDWDIPILHAYMTTNPITTATFQGWYFTDVRQQRIEFRHFPVGDNPWQMVRFQHGVERYVDSAFMNDDFLQYMPTQDIALNAIFSTRTPDERTTTEANHRLEHYGRRIDIAYGAPRNLSFASPITGTTVRMGQTFGRLENNELVEGFAQVDRLSIVPNHYLVGWRKENEADLLEPTRPFIIRPEFIRYVVNGQLVFTAVVTPTINNTVQPAVAGIYTKRVDANGNFAFDRMPGFTGGHPTLITDNTQGDLMNNINVWFYFNYGVQNNLRDINTPPIHGSFITPTAPMTNFVRTVTNGRLNLPPSCGYAVAGRVFAGWRSSFDGRIFPAGYEFNIPRYMPRLVDLRFTAVWVDATRLISFDANGGNVSWNDNVQRLPNSRVTLPTPTRWGFEFLGWEHSISRELISPTDDEGANNPQFRSFQITGDAQLLVARWQPRRIHHIDLGLGSELYDYFQNGASGEFYFGDHLILRRNSTLAMPHNGWRFIAGASGEFMEFHFHAPFIQNIRILINEEFATRHTGSRNESAFFERMPATISAQRI
ncbi:MAG: InlB B-repeat-containing protein [Firmicutes bacterium]|nr:InlB B-repeat-containing protein [Bacillota bacterium]